MTTLVARKILEFISSNKRIVLLDDIWGGSNSLFKNRDDETKLKVTDALQELLNLNYVVIAFIDPEQSCDMCVSITPKGQKEVNVVKA